MASNPTNERVTFPPELQPSRIYLRTVEAYQREREYQMNLVNTPDCKIKYDEVLSLLKQRDNDCFFIKGGDIDCYKGISEILKENGYWSSTKSFNLFRRDVFGHFSFTTPW